MNVLFISIDKTLTMPAQAAPQNSLARETMIGKRLGKYFIITMAQANHQPAVPNLFGHTLIYPVASKGMFSFLMRAYWIGKKICRENKIDMITTQDPLLTGLAGLLLRRTFKIPLNVQYHGDYLDNHHWLKEERINMVFNPLGKLILRSADTILVENPFLKDKILAMLHITGDKTYSLPYGLGIDIAHFQNRDGAKIRQRYVRDPEQKIVLFVGRLCQQKNLASFLKVMPDLLLRCPKTLLLIIGEGPEKQKLMRLSQSMNLQHCVRFIGSIPYEEIPDYYAACNVVILPSHYEGWPRVVMEAVVCEKPIVATDSCFVDQDPLTKAHCHIVPTQDISSWAKTIAGVLNREGQLFFTIPSHSKDWQAYDQTVAIDHFLNAWNKTTEKRQSTQANFFHNRP